MTAAATRSGIGILIREVLVFVDPVTVEGESLERGIIGKQIRHLPAVSNHVHAFCFGLAVEFGCLFQILLATNAL